MPAPWADPAPIRVGAPSLGDRTRLHRLLDEILDRSWLTNHGPVEREFEARLCDVVGTRHCIPVANATLGLLVALHVLVDDGEVLMPAFTFPAAAHVTRLLGLHPVFCDIDPHRHHLDPGDAEGHLTDRTGGLVAAHLWGRACDTEALERVSADRPVIYDAAHAFGATHRGRPIGANGRCEVFSFHTTKFVNTFEGGAIATNDDELAGRLRLAINFGFTGRDRVATIGVNAKMSEIHAAMGLVSLDLVPEIAATNASHLEQYQVGLAGVPGVRLMIEPDGGNLSFVVVEIDEEQAGCDRDAVLAGLRAAQIDTRRYFYPGVHRMEPHRSDPSVRPLPLTESICDRVLQLPTGLAISEDGIDHVCQALSEVVGRS